MGKFIDLLRTQDGFYGYEYNEIIEDLIDSADFNNIEEGYSVKAVHKKYEDGGRWSNYKTTVFEVTEGEDVAYFEVYQEVPATEMQDGGDFSTSFNEVRPVEKTIVVYE